MKRKWISHLPLLLIAFAMTFSPEFSLGTIGGGRNIVIRIEDLLLVILGLAGIGGFLLSQKTAINKPPLFFPIAAWLGFSAFVLLTNLILGNIEISRGFFYFLKEIEFFIFYFYVLCSLKSIDSAQHIIHWWIALGVGAMVLILTQFFGIIQRYGTYGPSLFMEPGPFPSGGFFLILFTALLNIFLYHYLPSSLSKTKKYLLALGIFPLAMGVILSASRTAIIGLVVGILISALLYQLKRKGSKTIFINVFVLLILGGILYTLIYLKPSPIRDLRPFEHFTPTAIERGRVFVWKDQINAFSRYSYFYILFGLGKSVVLTAEESHSQYVRNLIETGLIGSGIFFILIAAILKKSGSAFLQNKNPFRVALASGIFVNTVVMLVTSIAVEGFLVVRVAEIYWFFMAIGMAVLWKKENQLALS